MQISSVNDVVRDLGKLQSLKFPTRLKIRLVKVRVQLCVATFESIPLWQRLRLLCCPYVVTECCSRLVLFGAKLVVIIVRRTIRLRKTGMLSACLNMVLSLGDGKSIGLSFR